MPEADSNALIERWIAGDGAAGGQLYERYYTRVAAFAARIYGRQLDANDIAQQALLQGLEGIKGGARPDRFTQWILGVTRNAGREALRKEDDAIHGLFDLPDGRRGSELTRLANEESRQLFARIYKSLEPDQRHLLELRFVRGESRKDVAHRLRISTQALDKRTEKALFEVRRLLSRHFTTLILTKVSDAPLTLEAIDELRPSFRETFLLRHRDGLSVKGIAAQLGVPEKTVEGRLAYAYETLRADPEGDFSHLWPEE